MVLSTILTYACSTPQISWPVEYLLAFRQFDMRFFVYINLIEKIQKTFPSFSSLYLIARERQTRHMKGFWRWSMHDALSVKLLFLSFVQRKI